MAMPRIARLAMPDRVYHVTQRGNYRQRIFGDDTDRQQYVRWLVEYKAKRSLLVLAWCLMENHVHLVCLPRTDRALADTLRDTHMRYANYFNRKMGGVSGHLWQGRYYSCACDTRHAWEAIRYVERNPVRAGVVASAEEYPWSSARAHAGGVRDGVVDDGLPPRAGPATKDWSAWLRMPDDEETMIALRQSTRTGRPCGDTRFVSTLESASGRRLCALPRGRPFRETQ
jgi:putative transposase